MNSSEYKINSLYFYIWFHHFQSQFDMLWTQKKLWEGDGDSDISFASMCVRHHFWVVSSELKSTAIFKLWKNILIG